MRRISLLLAGFLGLAACGDTADGPGPFAVEDGTPDGGDNGSPPPGTEDPDASNGIPSDGITRREADGEARNIAYDPATDTFAVDNLPFDGDGTYNRDDQVPRLDAADPGAFAVYENNNGSERRSYKALYAEGPSGETRVGIVRTGAYTDLGFGGFVLERDGGVDLPDSGQATYTGGYAGVRVFNGQRGLRYSDGDARLEVDFEDFNATDAVEGRISDREVFDQAGNLIGRLPTLVFGTDSITREGEITGGVGKLNSGSGGGAGFEVGNYYAVLGGEEADEIVGVVVVEDGGVQETGAFVVTDQGG